MIRCPPAPKKTFPKRPQSPRQGRCDLAVSRAKRRLVFDDPVDGVTARDRDNVTPPAQIFLETENPPDAAPLSDLSPTGRIALDARARGESGEEDVVCACDPLERFLHCVEMMPTRADGRRYCPVCHKGRVRSLPNSADLGSPSSMSEDVCQHTSGSSETTLLSHVPNLTCDVNRFKGLKHPMLYRTDDDKGFWPVYVPRDDGICKAVCDTLDNMHSGSLAGRGAFGEVWRTKDGMHAAKKSKRLAEVMITVWLSGVVRSKAAELGSAGNNVHFNILPSIGCCVRHRVTTSVFFYSDMYHYQGWSPDGIASYRRAFFELAGGLRFLSFDCHVSHLDITPMNILVQTDPDFPYNIQKAVLCDYSLSEPHPPLSGKCVVVLQETMTAKVLPPSTFKLCESYHPAFRPIPLQRLVAANPQAVFPDGDTNRYCVAELCALANVAIFCLVRALDRRGVPKVMRIHEAMLFNAATAACNALEKGDMRAYAHSCLMILARQLSYAKLVLEEPSTSTVKKTCRFVDATFRQQWVEDFNASHVQSYQMMNRDMIRDNLTLVTLSTAGLQLIEALRVAVRVATENDLDVDPHTIFASDP